MVFLKMFSVVSPILCSTFVWSSCSWFPPMAYGLVQSSYFQPLEKTVYHVELSSDFLVDTSCLLPSLCNKEDHRGIEKIVEVKGCHVSLSSLPTLGISGRDSCKRGRFVTAQIWYPKIWAKFSLFALHCIMAYIFKLLN